jgi:hypothetical protein
MGISDRSIRELMRILEKGIIPSDPSAAPDLWYCLRELLELREKAKQQTTKATA